MSIEPVSEETPAAKLRRINDGFREQLQDLHAAYKEATGLYLETIYFRPPEYTPINKRPQDVPPCISFGVDDSKL